MEDVLPIFLICFFCFSIQGIVLCKNVALDGRFIPYVCIFIIFLFHYTAAVDVCRNNPCENNGTCTSLRDGFQCNCSSSWKGKNCSIGELDKNVLWLLFFHLYLTYFLFRI